MVTIDEVCKILNVRLDTLPYGATEICTNERLYPDWIYALSSWRDVGQLMVPLQKVRGSRMKGSQGGTWWELLMGSPRADSNLRLFVDNSEYYFQDYCRMSKGKENQQITLEYYKEGDFYFVSGGHHRICIAKVIGIPFVYARIEAQQLILL